MMTTDPVRAFRGHASPEVVELVRRYANRPDLLDDLGRLQAKLATSTIDAASADGPFEPGMARRGRRRLVSSLLAPEQITQLVARFESGTSKRTLAAEYGISESSVKRLLRQHSARQAGRS